MSDRPYWCEICARKKECYGITLKPKCFVPLADRKTEPQTDVYEYHNGKWTKPQTDFKMPYEDCEDCETHLKAQYAHCNKCKWYGDKQVCGRCRSKNLYAPKDEPQTEMTTEQIVNELLSIKQILDKGKMPTDCAWGKDS